MENRTSLFVLVLSILITFYSCDFKNERQTLRLKTAALEKELQDKDSAFNQILVIMDEAELKINQIKERENLITLESEGEIDEQGKGQIINDLSMIDKLLLETHNQVAALSDRLDQSNIELRAFKRRLSKLDEKLKQREIAINELKQELIAKDLEIKELTDQVQVLREDVDNQAELISMQSRLIDEQVTELNRAYYIVDKEKALLERGIISKEGGLLGMGKERDITSDIDIQELVRVDITKFSMIDINAKKFEIVSKHPSSSYSLIQDNGQVSRLEIVNSSEFWKVSKYLIISLKG